MGWTPLAISCLLLLPPFVLSQPPTKPGPRMDGDGLPPGAVARLGAARFRHPGDITFLSFVGGKQQLLAGSKEDDLRLWDVEGEQLRRYPPQPTPDFISDWEGTVGSITLSGDGKTMARRLRKGFLIQEIATGKEVRRFQNEQLAKDAGVETEGYFTVPFTLSSDGRLLAVADGGGKEGNAATKVAVWNTTTGGLVRVLELGDKARAGEVYFEKDHQTLTVLYLLEKKLTLGKWDLAKGQRLRTLTLELPGPKGKFAFEMAPKVQFLAEGKTLLMMDTDDKATAVQLGDAVTGKKLRHIAVQEELRSLRASADGKRLVGVGKSKVFLWDAATGKELRQLAATPGQEWGAAALSPDGQTLAVAAGNSVRLWDVDSGKERTWPGHRSPIASVAFSPGGDQVLTGSAKPATLLCWDVPSGRLLREFPFAKDDQDKDDQGRRDEFSLMLGEKMNLLRAGYTPDGKGVAASALGQPLRRWDAATAKPLPAWPNPSRVLWSFAYSPDGKYLALADEHGVRLVHPATGAALRRLRPDPERKPDPRGMPALMLGVLTFSGDGRTLFVSGLDPADGGWTGRGFEMTTGRQRLQVRPKNKVALMEPNMGFDGMAAQLEVMVLGLAVAPDGKQLVSAGLTAIRGWDLTTGRESRLYGGLGGMPATVTFSPDGRWLLAGWTNGSIRVWDAATAGVLYDVPGHGGAVTALAFSPDGRRLASGSADTTVLIWDWAALQKHITAAPPVQAIPLEGLWQALGGNDAGAHAAVAALTATPTRTVAFLKERLKPVAPADPQRVEQLLLDLDGKQFKARQEAIKELEKLGDLAAAAINKRLGAKMGLEMQQRLEALRDKLERPLEPGPLLQALRAVEVLEQTGTPEALQLLAGLATGAPGHRLTVEAAESVRRLKSRGP